MTTPTGQTTVRVETRCPRSREHVMRHPLTNWVTCPECYSVIITEVAVPHRPPTPWPWPDVLTAAAR